MTDNTDPAFCQPDRVLGRGLSEWADRVRVDEGATFIVTFRPPKQGERYLISDYVLTATHDWHHVIQPVIVGTVAECRP